MVSLSQRQGLRWLVLGLCSGIAALGCITSGFGAAVVVVDQGPYDPTLESRNSNTVTNSASDQQVADDFTVLGSGLQVTRIDLWFTYRDLVLNEEAGVPPASQNMLIQIYEDDSTGNPGAEVYQANVSFIPATTGETNGFFTPNEIYYAEIDLATPFQPTEGERYWLSPLGDNDEETWQWQMSEDEGSRWSRGGAGGPEWRSSDSQSNPLEGNFAFRMYAIPEPSSLLLVMGGGLLLLGRRSRQG